jgi:hypothetical protein
MSFFRAGQRKDGLRAAGVAGILASNKRKSSFFQAECCTMGVQEPLSDSSRQFGTPATVMVRPLLLKPQWMNGLSERLLVSHYENNYGGALRRLNAIRARLAALDWARVPGFEINGLKREELIAAGSVILHETYFDSLGGHGDSPPERTYRTASRTGPGACARFRQRLCVARGVYRDGKGASWRFRLGDPGLV